MVTENINIDVRPGGIPIVIHVTQYEAGLRQFVFTPYTSAGELTVVAGSATLEGTKPDGYAFQQACQMIDGVITYTLQEQLCAVEGRVWSRLVIRDTGGGMIGYTAIVWVVGCAGVKDDAVMSDSDISALRQFLDEFGTIDAYRGALNGALAAVGGPLVAATASAMTDTTKVYVYTGSESGYTEGHWYYWNGSAWTDGGVYQSTGINTDKTLTVEDMAADAKATGDAVAELKNDLGKYDFTPALTSADVVTGYYIRGDTGIPVSRGDYVCTDFIPILDESVGLELTCQCFFGSIVGCAFYSAKSVNAYLDGETGTGWTQKTVKTTIPDGAKFFRTTLQASAYTSPADFGIHYQRYIATIREDVDKTQNDVTTLTIYTDNNTKAIRKYPNWVNGTIDSAGNIYSRTDRLATGIMAADVASIKCVNDYYGLIAYYDEDKHFKEMTSFVKNFAIDHSSFPAGTYYIAVAVHNGTGSITTSEGENCILLYSVDDVVKGTFDQAADRADSVPFIEGSKNQIARLGWDVYNPLNPPQQTAQSYALAYKNGCRIMLCDVRITSDGKYVLWHDETLNNSVRHTDGSTLSDTEKAMTIAGSTLSELNVFDYGIYRGAEYAGMKIPMLDDFLKWCTLANCIPMLEIKVQLTETDCVAIAKMCKQYGLGDRVIVGEYYDKLQNTVNYWKANLPKCKLCIFAWGDVWTARDFINTNLANTDINVLLTISTTSQLYLISSDNQIDYSKIQTVTNLGAKLTFTEVNSSSVMAELYEGGYLDVISYISSSYIKVNAWLENALGLS